MPTVISVLRRSRQTLFAALVLLLVDRHLSEAQATGKVGRAIWLVGAALGDSHRVDSPFRVVGSRRLIRIERTWAAPFCARRSKSCVGQLGNHRPPAHPRSRGVGDEAAPSLNRISMTDRP